MSINRSLAIFCRVVDNYGDIGICWRLARQLQQEHALAVSLWVDDLQTFQRICPQVRSGVEEQQIAGVTVRHWRDQEAAFASDDVADIVIEFFACDIPPGYLAAMAARRPRPVWINLEGLSAEEWVEGCHSLSSPPRFTLTKYFFFPGFTGKTGGLLRESALLEQRRQFQSDRPAMAAFLAQLGLAPAEIDSFKISLFCYPQAPVAALFKAWENAGSPITCLVPEGVVPDAAQAFLAGPANPGARRTRGALTLHVVPVVSQPEYDKLLWACDLNFVRGEDSFVRAQWAGKPFVWHIYPQDKNLHHVKLRAFLRRYTDDMDPSAADALNAVFLNWNAAGSEDQDTQVDWPVLWHQYRAELPKIASSAGNWQSQMLENGDLTGNLLAFAASIRELQDA
ncbi:elongation factor P maturation arginine rhamnosyltransferase EarP [soil metagenome]